MDLKNVSSSSKKVNLSEKIKLTNPYLIFHYRVLPKLSSIKLPELQQEIYQDASLVSDMVKSTIKENFENLNSFYLTQVKIRLVNRLLTESWQGDAKSASRYLKGLFYTYVENDLDLIRAIDNTLLVSDVLRKAGDYDSPGEFYSHTMNRISQDNVDRFIKSESIFRIMEYYSEKGDLSQVINTYGMGITIRESVKNLNYKNLLIESLVESKQYLQALQRHTEYNDKRYFVKALLGKKVQKYLDIIMR